MLDTFGCTFTISWSFVKLRGHIPTYVRTTYIHYVRHCFHCFWPNGVGGGCAHHIPVGLLKTVAEVSKIGNLQESVVVVMRGWQSEPIDGSKGGWGSDFSRPLPVSFSSSPSPSPSPSIDQSIYQLMDQSIYIYYLFHSLPLSLPSIHLSINHNQSIIYLYLSVCLSVHRSIYLCIYLWIFLSRCLSERQ